MDTHHFYDLLKVMQDLVSKNKEVLSEDQDFKELSRLVEDQLF